MIHFCGLLFVAYQALVSFVLNSHFLLMPTGNVPVVRSLSVEAQLFIIENLSFM